MKNGSNLNAVICMSKLDLCKLVVLFDSSIHAETAVIKFESNFLKLIWNYSKEEARWCSINVVDNNDSLATLLSINFAILNINVSMSFSRRKCTLDHW